MLAQILHILRDDPGGSCGRGGEGIHTGGRLLRRSGLRVGPSCCQLDIGAALQQQLNHGLVARMLPLLCSAVSPTKSASDISAPVQHLGGTLPARFGTVSFAAHALMPAWDIMEDKFCFADLVQPLRKETAGERGRGERLTLAASFDSDADADADIAKADTIAVGAFYIFTGSPVRRLQLPLTSWYIVSQASRSRIPSPHFHIGPQSRVPPVSGGAVAFWICTIPSWFSPGQTTNYGNHVVDVAASLFARFGRGGMHKRSDLAESKEIIPRG